MRVIIVPDDRVVSIDGEGRNFDYSIDSNIHAIQWYGTAGHIEYNDGSQNLDITSISDYADIIAGYNAVIAEEVRVDLLDMPIETLRLIRDNLLTESDWTQLSDIVLTATKVTEWATYRQELRDWPANYLLAPERSPTPPTEPSA